MDQDLLYKWNELKMLVELTDVDVAKSASGNASAGVRARHSVRLIRKKAAEFVKVLLESSKEQRASKKA